MYDIKSQLATTITDPLRILLAISIAILAAFAGPTLWAQPTYAETNWSLVSSSVFSADQYPTGTSYMTAPPTPSSPFTWTLPYPYQNPSTTWGVAGTLWNDDTSCTYGDDYINGVAGPYNQLPMRISGTTSADAIVRTGPTYINRTSGMTGVQGIGVQVQFTGSSGSDAGSGQLLQQAVFFHSQRCYTAGTEFGFRKLVGTVSDYQNNSQTDLIEFYYALNSNCYGACQAQEQGGGGAWTTLSLYANGINTIPIKNWSTGSVCSTSSSGGCNSHGGTDWLYEAWLAPTGSSPYTYWWWVVARDPYCDTTVRGHAVCYDIVNDNGSPVPHQVESWFRGSNGSGVAPSPNTDFAYDIAHGGLAGYMTFTTSLSARFSNESTHASGGTSPITMNIVSAFAPYY